MKMTKTRQITIQEAFARQETKEQEEEAKEPEDPRARLMAQLEEQLGNFPEPEIVRKQLGQQTFEDYRAAMEKLQDCEDMMGIVGTESSKRKLWNKAQLETKVRLAMMVSDAGNIYEALEEFERYLHSMQRLRKHQREERKAVRKGKVPKRLAGTEVRPTE
jgi:hypothetical protein